MKHVAIPAIESYKTRRQATNRVSGWHLSIVTATLQGSKAYTYDVQYRNAVRHLKKGFGIQVIQVGVGVSGHMQMQLSRCYSL